MAFNLEYTAPKTVANYMMSDAKMRIIMGPQGSGKSSGSVLEIPRRALAQAPDDDGVRRSRWLVVRNTMPQLRTTTIKTFLDWIPPGSIGQWKETIKEYHIALPLPDGTTVAAEVMFLALDTPDDVSKLLSLESTGAYFNEFREISPEIYEGMTRRVGRYPSKKGGPGPSWYGIWADTNPPRRGSWLHRMMENLDENMDPLPDRTDDWKWDVFKQPSGRAPDAENVENLPPGYYNAAGLTPEYVKVMIDGEYGNDRSGNPIFGKTFSREDHVAKGPISYISRLPLLIGLDQGLTPAAVLAQMLPSGRLNILDNVYVKQGVESMGMERFLQERLLPRLASLGAQAKYNATIIADPASWQRSQPTEVTVADIVARYGLKIMRASTNALEPRIQAVEGVLTKRVDREVMLQIDPQCRWLIDALESGYTYGKAKGGEANDTPVKNAWSHCADAMQYLCLHANPSFSYQMRQRPKVDVKPAGYRYV